MFNAATGEITISSAASEQVTSAAGHLAFGGTSLKSRIF
jgi:hypothetical protein